MAKVFEVKGAFTPKKEKSNLKPLNECVQLGDTVKLDGLRGYVVGQVEGQVIVQIQGSTRLVDPNKLKVISSLSHNEEMKKPQFKFDEQTQKVLFEQLVHCGIYMGNVPVKFTGCYVKYSAWEKAKEDEPVKVLVEGRASFLPKSQIKILENINDFANEDNYVQGAIVDEQTEEAVESVLINAVDYSNAIGDADPVRIIKKLPGGVQEPQTMPKAALRTLAV